MRRIYGALWRGLADLAAERSRHAYWLPVLIGVGIGLYFAIPAEPPWWAVLPPLAPALVLCRWPRWRMVGFGLLAIILGFAAAQVRTARQPVALLEYEVGPLGMEGTLMAAEGLTRGSRIFVCDVTLSRNVPHAGEWCFRLNLPTSEVEQLPPAGSRLKLFATLHPPGAPDAPQGYNFRRQAFFEGISGYGYALRPPEVLAAVPETGPSFMAERGRQVIAGEVGKHASGAEGAIAAALMTGERGDIDEKTNADMRAAGTAHLLSISGMHIGMVGGIIFFMLRLGLALVPRLALRWPIKKIAAVGGLVGIMAYTWLVGSPVPAERAAMMTGLVFMAIVFDRVSLTLRGVALAAVIVLLIQPESLLHPGFQLSFAAILVLVAFYEMLAARQVEEKPMGWLRRFGRGLILLVMTSLLAGFATAPFAAYHFHRFQILGVLGNLIAVPLTGFIVMPAMIVAYIAMPLGLAEWPVQVMAWGLKGVTQSAAWVASLPGADINVPAFTLSSLLLVTFGGLWLCIWQSRWRYLGVGPVLAGLLLIPLTPAPLALIGVDGEIAVRAADGQLRYFNARAASMTVKGWSQGYDGGRPPLIAPKAAGEDMRCDKLGCTLLLNSQLAAVSLKPDSLPEDCRRAAIIISPEFRAGQCASALIFDRAWLKRHGSTALYAGPDGTITLETSRMGLGQRPWE